MLLNFSFGVAWRWCTSPGKNGPRYLGFLGLRVSARRSVAHRSVGFFEEITMKKYLLTLLGTNIAKYQLKQLTIESERL